MFAIVFIASLVFAGTASPNADGYGHVAFANSGAAGAQANFLEGLALLHDFEYPAAAEAFRRAQAIDPGFAMAFWGEAMTFNHPLWAQQNLAGARAALNKLAPTAAARRAKAKTDREQEYLNAVEVLYGEGSKLERDFRYQDAMAKLFQHYPDDVDAAAFYGLSILGTAHAGRDIPTYMRAARVLEEAWINHQEHPGLVHYLIHSYDDPAHAPLGLRSARIYSRIAPEAGHAQHMTSHIFLALGMWPETVQANLAAMAAVDRMGGGKNAVRCGHYPSWLGYAYLQLGKTSEARNALSACRASLGVEASIDHPGMSMDPDSSLTSAFANMRLRYLIDSNEWTGEIASWPIPKGAGPGARLDFAFAKILREINERNATQARQALTELETIGTEVINLETRNANPDPSYRLRPQILLLEARALLAESERNLSSAEQMLHEAIKLEETLPIDFGPPTIDKPTHELFGEFLLRHGRQAEARTEFEKALARTPGRRLSEQGRAVGIGSASASR